MPQCCVVPNCKGNYKSGPKVHVFSFPKNEQQSALWVRAIKRENFLQPTKNSKVCELHFKPNEIQWETSSFDDKLGRMLTAKLKIPRLVPGAVPSQFPNCPSYLSSSSSSRPSPDDRKVRLEEEALQRALETSKKEKQAWDDKVSFSSFAEFNTRMTDVQLADFWSVIKHTKDTLFVNLDCTCGPKINFSVLVNEDLKLYVFAGQVELNKLGDKTLPLEVRDILTVNEILNIVESMSPSKEFKKYSTIIDTAIDLLTTLCNDENFEPQSKVQFLVDQLSLLKMRKYNVRYSSDLLIFSSFLFSVAPNAYRFLRLSGNLTLPHPSTIHRICSSIDSTPEQEQQENYFLQYIKNKFSCLTESDKVVSLLMDEIHLKSFFDFKGGSIAGTAFDSKEAATSAYVFMICSIRSKFKDVIHIAPTRTMHAPALHNFIKKVILGLEGIGFEVICLVSDNNAINRKAVSFFLPKSVPKEKLPDIQYVFPHPANPSRPLFFLIDSVHLLKCIRNNWLNQKNSEKAMFFPPFPSESANGRKFLTASLYSLKDLHEMEFNSLLKYGYSLSRKALFPSNLERQNVKLVLQIFNEFVVQALSSIGEQHQILHSSDTAEYIRIISKWWSIVNVKTVFKGVRLRDPMKTPLSYSDSDIKFIFLNSFLDWLQLWEKMGCDTGILTRETHNALKVTTNGLLELASYCASTFGMKYILPGKFQTDNLESRFSLYRQLAGGQYNISVRQVFECEKKLHTQSLLKLALPIKNRPAINIESLQVNWELMEMPVQEKDMLAIHVSITEGDIAKCNDILPVITYLAGYSINSALKKLKCEPCNQEFLLYDEGNRPSSSQLIKDLDRGGLVYPHNDIVNAVLFTYIVLDKVLSERESDFLKLSNQRHQIAHLSLNVLKEQELIDEEQCENGHSKEKVFGMVIWSSCNALLNNYCKRQNELVQSNLKTKKRKLDTLKKSK